MEHRLGEILEEVVRVRREFGYPVMATPYSQIVGVQAFENVVSGERYKKITDESIKYLLGYYGEPAFPLDPKVMDRVMSLPRTKEFIDWKPEGYLKSVEELRREIGPDLSDDDLLLKILIPGTPLRRGEAGRIRRGRAERPCVGSGSARRRPAPPAGASPDSAGLPRGVQRGRGRRGLQRQGLPRMGRQRRPASTAEEAADAGRDRGDAARRRGACAAWRDWCSPSRSRRETPWPRATTWP